jgi:hypothetical protein
MKEIDEFKRYRNQGSKGAGLDDLEQRLQAVFLPATPRVQFVDHLRTRVEKPVASTYQNRMRLVFLTFAGLVSSLLILLTGIRTIRLIQGIIRNRKTSSNLTPIT